MAVRLRIKYYGDDKLTNKNRPYKYQLDYYHNGKRVREVLKDIVVRPSDNNEEKKQKKAVAENYRSKLEIELASRKQGITSRQFQKANFISFFEELSKKKTDNTKSSWDNTLNHLKKFQGKKLTFENLTTAWLESFNEYLLTVVSTNSAITYLNKLNAALNYAVKQRFINYNPFKHFDRPKKEESNMIFLTENEVRQIIKTEFYDQEVKNAFLFSCYTGLRISDIQRLKWEMIKESRINLTMKKTGGTIYIPLGENAKFILSNQIQNNEFVFKLSTHSSSTNRTLRKLIDKTTIEKDVSFHSGRHTFATLLITSGVSIFTVSKLLGHKDIESTLVYAKVIDEVKESAVKKMPKFS